MRIRNTDKHEGKSDFASRQEREFNFQQQRVVSNKFGKGYVKMKKLFKQSSCRKECPNVIIINKRRATKKKKRF